MFANQLAAGEIEVFHEMHGALPKVKYNPEWANGTGYLDGATDDVSITTLCASTDELGRQIILFPYINHIGNRCTGVIFSRYVNRNVIVIHVESGGVRATDLFQPRSTHRKTNNYILFAHQLNKLSHEFMKSREAAKAE